MVLMAVGVMKTGVQCHLASSLQLMWVDLACIDNSIVADHLGKPYHFPSSTPRRAELAR